MCHAGYFYRCLYTGWYIYDYLYIPLYLIPVKILVNASSTLVESNADVSINAKLFLSVKTNKQLFTLQSKYTHGDINLYTLFDLTIFFLKLL